jgi:hypothetical protein
MTKIYLIDTKMRQFCWNAIFLSLSLKNTEISIEHYMETVIEISKYIIKNGFSFSFID